MSTTGSTATLAGSFHPSLGEPGCVVRYTASPLLPQDVGEDAKHLPPFVVAVPPASLPHIFAHRQWRAGMILADLIAAGHIERAVKGRLVLELGCGTALPSLVAAHPDGGGARFVLATDYDEPELVRVLKSNIAAQWAASEERQHLKLEGKIRATGFTWATSPDDLFDLIPSSVLASRRTSIVPASQAAKFDSILLADTLWDSLSHADLAKSIAQTLARTEAARVIVVAGLHTGRDRIAEFVKKASRHGLEVASLSQDEPGVSSLRERLDLIEEPDLQAQLAERSTDVVAFEAWTERVLEFELALEPDEISNSPEDGTTSALNASRDIIASKGPRLTGRRRRFVSQEGYRPEEAKERGGVRIRNRWMTLWMLQWTAHALQSMGS